MIIDGIEYNILLFVEDENGEAIEEFNFENFEKFNEFVRERKLKSNNCKFTYSYTFIEMYNGEPNTFSWTAPIELEEIDQTQAEKMINEYREWLVEMNEDYNKLDVFLKEIHYHSDGEKHNKKGLEDFCYVCPRCLNVVEECECHHYPYYLVQIDRLILPIIKELNLKGYQTTGCCAGHPSKETKFINIYIAFDQDYDFDFDIPEGAKYSKLKHTISFEKEVTDIKEAISFQQECLDKLSDWAELLFEIYEYYEDDDIDE